MTTSKRFDQIIENVTSDLLSSGYFEFNFNAGHSLVDSMETENKSTLEFMYSINKDKTLSFKWYAKFLTLDRIKFSEKEMSLIIKHYEASSAIACNFWKEVVNVIK